LKVELRAASLNTNDVFLLKTGGKNYIWYGRGSTGDEREMAKKTAAVIAPGEQEIIYEGTSTYSQQFEVIMMVNMRKLILT